MFGKRGLSTVIATLLVILLVVVAVGVIAVVLRNFVNSGTSGISLSKFTINLQIQSVSTDSGGNINLTARREPGEGNVLGLKFIFSDGSNSNSTEERILMNEYDSRLFSYNLNNLGVPEATTVSIAPIIQTEQGSEILGDITDTYDLTGGSGSSDVSGTGSETPVCPNGVQETGEECDGSDFGSTTCVSLGYVSGTLGCYDTNCTIYTTSCVSAAPNSCDGVWNEGLEDVGVVCDGGLGCSVSCTCETGYIADGIGGCVLSPALLSGNISSVWPGSAPKYFDSIDLPTDGTEGTYAGKYVNISGIPGVCPTISDITHLVDGSYDMTYIELDFVVTGMDSSDTFQIWNANPCSA